MSLKFKFIPLTFQKDENEIKKQIRNTIILKHFFEKSKSVTKLNSLIVGTQYGYNASALESGKNKFLRISDITDGKVDWETVPFCDCDDEETYLLKADDILIARTGGTTGKSFKISNPPEHSIYAGYLIRIRANEENEANFINLFLNSYVYWSQIVSLNEGEFRPSANANTLKNLLLPDCPKTQQQEAIKISNGIAVKGYEELLNEIETALTEYDNCKQLEIESVNQLSLIEPLRQSILQEAIQGKLTENWRAENPNTEPAEKLLQRIKTEKEKTAKTSAERSRSKGKKSSLPEITESQIPFELPENWVWCRLGETGELKRGKSKHRPRNDKRLFENGKYPFIQTGDVSAAKYNNDLITTTNNFYSEFGLQQSEMQSKGTLCITIAANIAECGFLDFDACVPDSIVCFNSLDRSTEKYVYYFIKTAKENLERFAPATAQKNINLGILNALPIPLPPLSEQHAIVEQVEKLLGKCTALQAEIENLNTHSKTLLKALFAETFANND